MFLGFSANHIGGRDEPAILTDNNFNIILDSKTTKEGVITEGYINFDSLGKYKNMGFLKTYIFSKFRDHRRF
jgi:hypothetical protein